MSHPATPPDTAGAATSIEHAQQVGWADPARGAAFRHWLHQLQAGHGLQPESLRVASADASFRRYLRITGAHGSRIIMDAPPDKEDCRPFDHVARLMADADLNVPQVLAWDQTNGFMLLSDLGTRTMMELVQPDKPQANLDLYLQAVDALLAWQLASRPDVLPPCSVALLRSEMELFPQWYLTAYRGVVVDAAMRNTLDQAFAAIIAENLGWPSVYVHADFMPRNLIVSRPRLGILDFQDAVYGPITYDLVSLLRDAYVGWQEEQVLDWAVRYWEKARKAGLPVRADFAEFYRDFEWMGAQRQLKVIGIFARLCHRDGKQRYLADIPRVLGYLLATCRRYRELAPLAQMLEDMAAR